MQLKFRISALTLRSNICRVHILASRNISVFRMQSANDPMRYKNRALNYGYFACFLRFIAVQISRTDDLSDRQYVLESVRCQDLFRGTMMITGYSRLGQIDKALEVFNEMPVKDSALWNAMMKGCIQCGELNLAWEIFHIMSGRNVISWTTIIDGLARCGRIAEAEELFFKMPQKDTASWNSMISGYCSNGRIIDAVLLFERMPYRNVISWTAMICGLDQNGKSEEALSIFQKMMASGCQPTSDTYASVLTACSNATDMHLGGQVYAHIIKYGILLDTFVLTSLITFYAKCKHIESSRKILEEQKFKSVASWTALITGYGSNNDYQRAIDAFHCMKRESIIPNQSTFTSVLNSCGELEDLEKGREIHGNAVKLGFGFDLFVGNSLIFMYSKCGEVNDALTVFNKLTEKNIVSWNSIITGCAQNGHGLLTLKLYKNMVLNLTQPDEITFVGLLTACSHTKMVNMAKYLYRLLHHDGSLEPRLEHCICMVDVLGRSGNLEEAEDFINNMPLEPNKAVWLSLLSACRGHPNQLNIARHAAETIVNLEPGCSAAYTLLSNMYASEGQWDDVSLVRSTMRYRKVLKEPGHSGLH